MQTLVKKVSFFALVSWMLLGNAVTASAYIQQPMPPQPYPPQGGYYYKKTTHTTTVTPVYPQYPVYPGYPAGGGNPYGGYGGYGMGGYGMGSCWYGYCPMPMPYPYYRYPQQKSFFFSSPWFSFGFNKTYY